jgi:hypothetical protein
MPHWIFPATCGAFCAVAWPKNPTANIRAKTATKVFFITESFGTFTPPTRSQLRASFFSHAHSVVKRILVQSGDARRNVATFRGPRAFAR